MLNRELLLRDGRLIFPSYMDRDERAELRRQFGEERHYAWCTCRDDVKLWYRLSKDLKFYPEEQGYLHMPGCVFAADKEKDSYEQNPVDGGALVSLRFDPSEFHLTADNLSPRTGKSYAQEEPSDADPSLALHEFVRNLNWDTFNEREALGKSLLSKDYFAASLYGRMKHVQISGLKKALRDYNLNDDGWQFFYKSYYGTEISGPEDKRKVNLKFKLADGKEYTWFTYTKMFESACKRFERMYGKAVDEADNVIVAGIRYRRQSKKTGKPYTVIGRLCIFMVNENGVYARSAPERKNLDVILGYQRNHSEVRYFLSGTTDNFDGYFIKTGTTKKYIITGKRDASFGRHEVLRKGSASAQITEENIAELLARGKDEK